MAIMAKQILILVSSILIFTSCNSNSKKNSLQQNLIIRNNNEKKKSITLDSSINNLTLRDTSSILKNIGDIHSLIEDDFNKGECVKLLNKDDTEILMLKREYGGYKNQYSYFYIEKFKGKNLKYKRLKDLNFISTNGASIGMDKSDFLKKYPNLNSKTISDTLVFFYRNDDNIYQSKYSFVKDKLISFEFGYQD